MQFYNHQDLTYSDLILTGSQARGQIGAVAAALCHSHSNVGSELHLRPTPQLMATPDPSPTEQGQGLKPQPHGSYSDSLTTEP